MSNQGQQQQSQITIDDKTGDVYLEAFLIDALSLNDKGWKVSYDDPDSFDSIVQKSIGHPLVLYEKQLSNGVKVWTHPVSESGDVFDDIEFQKPFVVGKAVHNKKVRDGLWHTTYKIINEGAKRFLKGVKERSISLFTSPHIVRPVLEDRQNIKNWGVIHNAIVSKPANDKQLARVASICEGSPQSACASLFASMDTPDKDGNTKTNGPNCGYCLGDSLKEYIQVTSHSLKTESSSSMSDNSSGQGQQQATGNNGQAASTSNNNPAINNDNGNGTQTIINQSPSGQQQQQQQQLQQQEGLGNNDEAQKTIASLRAEIEQLKSQNSNIDTTKNQEKRIANLEKELALTKRTASVEKLLTQAIVLYTDDNGAINEKEYDTDLKKLVDSNHNLDEIQELIQARFVLHQNAKGKLTGNKASSDSIDEDQKGFSSQVTESASSTYTEMNAIGASTATKSLESKLSQGWVNVLNHLNNERLYSKSRLSVGGSY